MDLFEYQQEKFLLEKSPLSVRVRPNKLEDFVGQDEIINKNSLLYRAIKSDRLSSLIFYGPSGTGKTTLAKIIAKTTSNYFEEINATTSGIKDMKEIIENAKLNLSFYNKKTIIFIDEIHRFNKSQQDYLLSYVENGIIILIGATTENPYFEINNSLISRSTIFELKPLSESAIKKIILNAIKNKECGFNNINIDINEDALNFIAKMSNGDARKALNSLEIAILTTEIQNNFIKIDIDTAKECIQRKSIFYDKNGDNHYDTISAFIKSMRGSDPDATLFYLAKMIHSGEDAKFIARRIIICASEDVGNADPRALQIAVSAAQAVEFVGFPEARIILAQAAIYIATAPKSNSSYLGIDLALNDIKNIKIKNIPNHLKDSHYKNAKNLNRGLNYKYAHNYKNNYIKQQYLPDEVKDKIYYSPSSNGYEKRIKEWLNFLNNNPTIR